MLRFQGVKPEWFFDCRHFALEIFKQGGIFGGEGHQFGDDEVEVFLHRTSGGIGITRCEGDDDLLMVRDGEGMVAGGREQAADAVEIGPGGLHGSPHACITERIEKNEVELEVEPVKVAPVARFRRSALIAQIAFETLK